MKVLKLTLPILSSILLAAHFLRVQNNWLALACFLFPFILISKKKWVMRLYQVYLFGAVLVWIERTMYLVKVRLIQNMPWMHLAVALGLLVIFTLLSMLVFEGKKIRSIFEKGRSESTLPVLSTVLLTAGILSVIQLVVKEPVMLLFERFNPGAGWAEIMILSLYAGWTAEKVLEPSMVSTVRNRLWTFFSVVFFLQLLLGLMGVEKLLMTGKLHLPVPALIIAGPLFRGDGFFMLILFIVTVLLVGPAWCSYLCYIGVWDNRSARWRKAPAILPRWRHWVRPAILAVIIGAAVFLRYSGFPTIVATIAAAVFGLLGVGVMVFVSKRKGSMVHCVAYCPMGLAADWLGRLSPFRLYISDNCTECGACRIVCRYDALNKENIKKRQPALSCTLCGDCLNSCNDNALHYGFLKMNPYRARILFVVLVVTLHAVFLGVARL
jgi:NAD-dependent dihydropyrimidine dehydrogenase PreA subunit